MWYSVKKVIIKSVFSLNYKHLEIGFPDRYWKQTTEGNKRKRQFEGAFMGGYRSKKK